MGYCVVNYVLDAYTLQDNTTCDGGIITSGELVVRAQYMRCTKENMKWYWEQTKHQKTISVLTCTSVHPYINVW